MRKTQRTSDNQEREEKEKGNMHASWMTEAEEESKSKKEQLLKMLS